MVCRRAKKLNLFSPWICMYLPKKVCVWSPSFTPRGWHQEVDSKKVVRHCKPAFVSILLPNRNFNLKPRHLGRISTQFCKAKESRHTVPSWTGKAPSTEDFQLQRHYWSSGLKADLFKLTQSALRHQKTARCHLNPKTWSQAVLCSTEIDTECICILPSAFFCPHQTSTLNLVTRYQPCEWS